MNACTDQLTQEREGFQIPRKKSDVTPLGIPDRKDGKPRNIGGNKKGRRKYTSDCDRYHLKRTLEEPEKQLELKIFDQYDRVTAPLVRMLKRIEELGNCEKQEGRTSRTGWTGRTGEKINDAHS